MQPTVQVLENRFCIIQVASMEEVSAAGTFLSVTRTKEEVSVICEERFMPDRPLKESRGWRGLRLVGRLKLDLVGIVAGITAALKNRGVSVCVIATYDTDYFFVHEKDLKNAIDALLMAGYTVVE